MSVSLSAQASEMKAIQELQVWVADNLRKKLSVQVLADRVTMSVRNFERVFTREVGRTPPNTFCRRAWRQCVTGSSERTEP
ncbi:MAG TPA: AraC family transcriptional regulator [Candidatus Dormibacteraeota bacterium]|nr:AraC family transcriptional regulator [Candidatus Dormibacteraeota bacterium]